MSDDRVFANRDFLRALDVGTPQRQALALDGAATAAPVFDAAQQQAVVVGAEVVSFTQPIEANFREAISDCALVAQLAANARITRDQDPIAWFDAYFATLGGLGWTTQVRDTAEYQFEQDGVFVHEAIMKVVTAFLGPVPGAVALVSLALESLKSMDKDSPWITLFNHESEHAKIGRFQFTLIRRGDDNSLLADAMSFAIEAERKIDQILFFKASKTKTHMRRSLATVSISDDSLDGLRPILKNKIAAYRAAFLLDLPLKAG